MKNFLKLNSTDLENVRKPLDDWKLYHEMGHGIVAHLFDGFIYKFEKVTFKIGDAEQKQIHPDDSGYTIAKPVEDADSKAKSDIHKVVLVDGLYILSGIAGTTFLAVPNDQSVTINASNFEKELDLKGANGDFDLIRKAKRPYGWYLNAKGVSAERRLELHSKLIQILKESFSHPEVVAAAQVLYTKLRCEGELFPSDFQSAFGDELTQEVNGIISDKLSVGNFGQIEHVNEL